MPPKIVVHKYPCPCIYCAPSAASLASEYEATPFTMSDSERIRFENYQTGWQKKVVQ